MRALSCLALFFVACATAPHAAAPPPDVFPTTLSGTPRTLLFDGRFEGTLANLPVQLNKAPPPECVPKVFTIAIYGDVVLGYSTFASEAALDTCLLAMVDRPLGAVLRMLRAAKFAWFTKRNVGLGLNGPHLIGTFKQGGLDDEAKRLTDAWHESLGIRSERRELDLDMLMGQ